MILDNCEPWLTPAHNAGHGAHTSSPEAQGPDQQPRRRWGWPGEKTAYSGWRLFRCRA